MSKALSASNAAKETSWITGEQPLHVVRLPRQKQKAKQVAERTDQGNDFGRQPTARASDGLMPCPPFAPEAF